MENNIVIKRENALALSQETNPIDIFKPLQKEIFLQFSYVAGITRLKDKDILMELEKGDALVLKRDKPDEINLYPIGVFDQKGRKIGYIPEKDSDVFARLMDAGKMINATVESNMADGLTPKIEIRINMIDF